MNRDAVMVHRQTKMFETNIQAFLRKTLGHCLERMFLYSVVQHTEHHCLETLDNLEWIKWGYFAAQVVNCGTGFD